MRRLDAASVRARRGRPPAPVGKRKGLTFSVTQLTAPGGPVTQSAPKWQVQTSLYSTDVLYCTEQYYCTCRVVDNLSWPPKPFHRLPGI